MTNKKLSIKTLNGQTLSQLLDITSGVEINEVVQGMMDAGQANVRIVGGRQENASQIMLATSSIKALTEVVGSNTQDAMTAKYVQETGYIPSSPRDSVAKRLDFKGGRFETKRPSNVHLQDSLKAIKLQIRGHVSRGEQPTTATLDIRDHGVGVKPESVASTLCGLGGGDKASQMYYAGAFAQGAKAALYFANSRPNQSFSVCQMIVTSHFRNPEKICVSFIRFNRRDGRDGYPTARTPIWEYLVDPKTDKPWVFKRSDLEGREFKTGTLIRLYDYPLGIGAAGKLQRNSSSLDAQIRRTLPDPLLPFAIEDLRTSAVGNPSWKRYLSSKKSVYNHFGTLHKLHGDRKIRFQKSYKLNLGVKSSALLRVFVFDYTTPTEYLDQFVSSERPFVFMLNGQNQGEMTKHLLTHEAGLGALNKRFFALLDMDEASIDMKNNIFSSTRESIRQTADLALVRSRVLKTLQADDALQQLNLEYRDSNSSSTAKTEELMALQIVNKFIQHSRTENPHGMNKLKTPSEEMEGKESLPDIPVSDTPELFELKGDAIRTVAKGRNFRIRIDTDVSPELFSVDGETFMVDCPYGYLTYQSCSLNDGGRKSFLFSVDASAPSDVIAHITLTVLPPNSSPLSCSLELTIEDPAPRPPQDEGLPFQIKTVTDEHLLETLEMTRDDVSLLRQEGDIKIVYLNMLNKTLQAKIETLDADGRFKSAEEVVKSFKAIYMSEGIITAWQVFEGLANQEVDIDTLEALIRCGSKSALSTLMRTTRTFDSFQKYLN